MTSDVLAAVSREKDGGHSGAPRANPLGPYFRFRAAVRVFAVGRP
jgi:hypothetical protein